MMCIHCILSSLGVLLTTDNMSEHGMNARSELVADTDLQSYHNGTKKQEKKMEDS